MPRKKSGLRAEEQGTTPPGSDLLPADFSGDDVLMPAGELFAIDELAEAGEIPQVEPAEGESFEVTGHDVVAIDVRTDGFFTLKWHGKRDWPIGLRLGSALTLKDVRGVSGELTSDAKGPIAWFQMLPGEVNFRDGTRVVLRYQMVDGYVVDMR